MATLSQLLGRSGVWEGRGLSKPVLAMRTPVLVDAARRPNLPELQEVRRKPRGLTANVISRPSTAGTSKAIERYVPPPASTEQSANEHPLDVFGDNEPSSESEFEGEAEAEGETTGSELAESEVEAESEAGDVPSDLNEDDDVWEAKQEEALAEAQSAATPCAADEEDAPSLKVKKPYILPHKVKHATRHEIVHSSNFAKNGDKFYRQWLQERRDYRNQCREREERKAAKQQSKIDKKATRKAQVEARREEREKQEANARAEREESRRARLLANQAAEVERREAKGGLAVVPNGERNPTVLTIRANPLKIKIGGNKGKAAIKMADGGKERKHFIRCDICNIRRQLPEGATKPEPDVWFECSEVGKRCGFTK